jgi:hypothetical protein
LLRRIIWQHISSNFHYSYNLSNEQITEICSTDCDRRLNADDHLLGKSTKPVPKHIPHPITHEGVWKNILEVFKKVLMVFAEKIFTYSSFFIETNPSIKAGQRIGDHKFIITSLRVLQNSQILVLTAFAVVHAKTQI